MKLLVLLGGILVAVCLAAGFIESVSAKAQTKACPAEKQVYGRCIE